MRKGFLLLSLASCFAYFTLSSNKTGYTVLNVSGSDVVGVGCGGPGTGCHNPTPTPLMFATIVLDSSGTLVTKYTPGKSYKIRLVAGNASTASLPAFGFQLTAVKASALANAGAMTAGAGMAITTIGVDVMSHTAPMTHFTGTGGIGTTYRVDVPWTAPAAGTGAVRFCAVVNAVDSDGTANTADKWDTTVATFQERTVSEVPSIANDVQFSVYPNPVTNVLKLTLNNVGSGDYAVQVYDLIGRAVYTGQVEVNGSVATADLDLTNSVPGIYNVSIRKDGFVKVIPVLKQ